MLLPGVTSLYYREEEFKQEYGIRMLLGTGLVHQQALLDCLESHHPYQTSELLALPVTREDNDYLSWPIVSLC